MNKDTKGSSYTEQLIKEQRKKIKSKLKWMNPYALHVKKVCVGRVLDVGCGIGRNLEYLGNRAVGVDHNKDSIIFAQSRGFNAVTTEELDKKYEKNSFDTLLMAHLLEHMPQKEGKELVSHYKQYLKPGGRVVVICPQEMGFKHDDTHVEFLDFKSIESILNSNDISRIKKYSFPFFRFMGKFYVFNEFVFIGEY